MSGQEVRDREDGQVLAGACSCGVVDGVRGERAGLGMMLAGWLAHV